MDLRFGYVSPGTLLLAGYGSGSGWRWRMMVTNRRGNEEYLLVNTNTSGTLHGRDDAELGGEVA